MLTGAVTRIASVHLLIHLIDFYISCGVLARNYMIVCVYFLIFFFIIRVHL